ncbi:MAG TPA: DedA family protein [Ureibacillus sp.]|nr:DedA family protein [Ureibacillus sp.]
METWITTMMEDYGYLGVFLLIMLENLFPPIPSEVILTFGGFMTTSTDLTVTGVIIASTIGSVAGGVILYGICAIVGIKRLERFVDRWGKVLRLTSRDIHKANAWFEKYDVWTVFFCRFVPLIRSLISLPAGLAKMNFSIFLLLTTLGTLIWNMVLVNLGAAVGDSWESIVGYMDIYSDFAYAILALIFIVIIIRFYRKKVRR